MLVNITFLQRYIHPHSGSLDPRAVTDTKISRDRNSNKKISVNKNPTYQDIHSIQTNTPVYETVM